MKNITNKELQRMKNLMGIKKPINESNILSSTELIKEVSNGKFYGIVRENKKYFIKESNDGINFDFIGGLANKTKNQFESYEQAVRRLNLMLEDTDVLTPDIISEKKFVIKTKKKKKKAAETDDFGFGGEEESTEEGGDDFDFGDEEGESEEETTDEEGGDDFDFGGEEGESEEETTDEEGGDDFDFGDEEGGDEETGDEESTEEESDEDLDLEDDPIKSIQKMTGKLGQKLRDTEDVSSDMSKWVAKSVISALDLDQMDAEDKKDIIRAIKKKKDEGSDEEFDFMSDMADWSKLTTDERRGLINREEDDMYGPGDGELEKGEEIILDDEDNEDNCSYCGDRDYNMPHDEDEPYETYPGINEPDWRSRNMSYMSKYGKSVKKQSSRIGKKVDEYDLDEYLRKVKNKLGGSDNVDIDDDKVVGEFGYVEVTPSGYVVHKEGEKFSKKFNFDELGKLHSYVRNFNEDYMDDPYMMPQPRPQTRPHETPVKPAKPGTDRPSPSKRPFTAPPHITPGEEPNPKARYRERGMNPYMMPQPRPQTRPHETPVKPAKPGTGRPSPSKRPFTAPPHITPGEEPNPKARGNRRYYDSIEDYGTNQGMDYMEEPEYYGSFEKNKWLTPMDTETHVEGPGYEYDEFEYPDYESFRTSEFGSDPENKWFAQGDTGKRFFDQYKDKFGPMKVRKKKAHDYDETSEMFGQLDYMEDTEMCHACEGKGVEMNRIGFSRKESNCPICDGVGYLPRHEVGGEVDEPYVHGTNPMGYKSSHTLPNNVKPKYQYREKFNFPFNMGENKRKRKSLKEDHINDRMATYDQELAYEDVEAMARQNGMEVEFCHKDRSKDVEEQTIYLDLMKNGKAVAKIRINSVGQVEMGHMNGKVFKGEPVDSYPDFDEVLREKRIKMSPAPAPARPETPTREKEKEKERERKTPPSRKPFTPPPHITPGEEPNPKARNRK